MRMGGFSFISAILKRVVKLTNRTFVLKCGQQKELLIMERFLDHRLSEKELADRGVVNVSETRIALPAQSVDGTDGWKVFTTIEFLDEMDVLDAPDSSSVGS
mgnify:CR=1 FL=1